MPLETLPGDVPRSGSFPLGRGGSLDQRRCQLVLTASSFIPTLLFFTAQFL